MTLDANALSMLPKNDTAPDITIDLVLSGPQIAKAITKMGGIMVNCMFV